MKLEVTFVWNAVGFMFDFSCEETKCWFCNEWICLNHNGRVGDKNRNRAQISQYLYIQVGFGYFSLRADATFHNIHCLSKSIHVPQVSSALST